MRTVRWECLDWLLILNPEYLKRVLDVFVAHYNGHRPHRALALTPPHPTRPPSVPTTDETRVQRRDRLGGVIDRAGRVIRFSHLTGRNEVALVRAARRGDLAEAERLLLRARVCLGMRCPGSASPSTRSARGFTAAQNRVSSRHRFEAQWRGYKDATTLTVSAGRG